MTYREIFTKLLSDLSKLNPNEVTVVTYNAATHQLTYRQFGTLIMLDYLRPLYLGRSKSATRALTQNGLARLKYSINELLKDQTIDEYKLTPDIKPFGTDWYTCIPGKFGNRPTRVLSLSYVNIKNGLMTRFLCNQFNDNSRLTYKVARNEQKGKGNK